MRRMEKGVDRKIVKTVSHVPLPPLWLTEGVVVHPKATTHHHDTISQNGKGPCELKRVMQLDLQLGIDVYEIDV